MRGILAIMERELRAYFVSVVGYVVMAGILFLAGYYFFYIPLALGEGSLRFWFRNFTITLLLLAPALTMRLFAEERKIGTIELLMTSPVTDAQVVLGKFLGSVAFYLILLVLTLQYPIVLFIVGNPDRGPIISGYIGLILFGAAFLSVGLLLSTTTKSQVVAFVSTFVILLMLYLLSWGAEGRTTGLARVLNYLSLNQHLENFAKGVIDTGDVIFYLTFIGLCLFLSVRSLAAWKWR